MYIVKLNGRKLTLKMFKEGFNSYERARQALRKFLRSKGEEYIAYTKAGYSIQKVQLIIYDSNAT